MMRFLKKILKLVLYVLAVPVAYLLVSILLTSITVNETSMNVDSKKSIYISTNGVHLDIIMPVSVIEIELVTGLNIQTEKYVSFGWGDENFYLNTPTWNDLTFKNAFNALFLNSSTLLHLTKYENKKVKWVEVPVTEKQLSALNSYILKAFKLNDNGEKIILKNKGYAFNDAFYRANGSYSCFYTCNTWVNSVLKHSGLKSSYWTPFDFGVINKYED